MFSPPTDWYVFIFKLNSPDVLVVYKSSFPTFHVDEIGFKSQHVASASPTKYLMVLENNVKLEFSFLEALGLSDPGVGIFWPSRP